MKAVSIAALSFALALSGLAAAPSAAQVFQRPQSTQPAQPSQPRAPNRAQMQPHGVTQSLETRTPRFTLKVFRFEAINETGSTNIGSDEVEMTYQTPSYWTSTSEFGDVDNGEARDIPVWQQCVFPARDADGANNSHWTCEHEGRPGPIYFTITLSENDWAFIPNARYCPPGTDLRLHTECPPISQTGNIGYFTREFTAEQLVNLLPQPWDSRDLTQDVGGHDSHYRIHYRITRTSDLVSAPHSTQ
jgi:hypothetical protein